MIDEGSTVPIIAIDDEETPKVLERVLAIKNNEAPKGAQKAEKNINKMLSEDNGTAWFGFGEENSSERIEFPGLRLNEEPFETMCIKEYGTLDGEVIRVGGNNESVPLILKIENETISGFTSNKEIAIELGKFLYKPVRIHGIGKWKRDTIGWTLDKFLIEKFEPLEKTTLSQTIAKLRNFRGLSDKEATATWNDLADLHEDRDELN